VAAIMAHMNGDHLDDNLLIVRVLAGRPAARSARMSGMDADGIEFEVDGHDVVRLPWSKRLTERAEVRREVVAMYERAGGAPRH
jgi:putative heme iron utilization protein